jgi:DNA-binding SARP family transcriptional activator
LAAILQLTLLGPFQAELDGKPVQFETRKAEALIAYLVVGGQPVSRSSLTTLFWPEYDTERAYHNLRRVLWSCNKALGKGWLEASAETIELEREKGVHLDTQAFQAHLAGCQTHGHTPLEVCRDCLAPLGAAADLYRGEFMAGFTLADSPEFDDWQFFQRERWKNEINQVLSRLVSGWAGQGENERAIQYARRWLALDPLNEIAHSELMWLYAQSGQRTAALRQYEILSQVLEKELGVRPSQETLELFNRIRSGTNGLLPKWFTPVEGMQTDQGAGQPQEPIQKSVDPSGYPETSSRLPVALTPFIGRKEELAEISRLVNDPACRLLTILGPGGIGKTRLALQVAYEIENTFDQGSYFVPLAPLASAEHIIPAIVGALQFSFYDSEKNLRQQLFDFLRQKQVLLVLDNFEQLIGEDSLGVLLDLMSAAPQVKLVVTSRFRLNITGEHLYPLAGLTTPEIGKTWSKLEDLVEFSALQLFIQSARRARPDFELSEENLTAVASICQAVQGMPLGIELAAAWLELL